MTDLIEKKDAQDSAESRAVEARAGGRPWITSQQQYISQVVARTANTSMLTLAPHISENMARIQKIVIPFRRAAEYLKKVAFFNYEFSQPDFNAMLLEVESAAYEAREWLPPRTPLADNLAPTEIQILHSGLGMLGESLEFWEKAFQGLTQTGDLKFFDLILELGDIEFYQGLFLLVTSTPPGEVWDANDDKLYYRLVAPAAEKGGGLDYKAREKDQDNSIQAQPVEAPQPAQEAPQAPEGKSSAQLQVQILPPPEKNLEVLKTIGKALAAYKSHELALLEGPGTAEERAAIDAQVQAVRDWLMSGVKITASQAQAAAKKSSPAQHLAALKERPIPERPVRRKPKKGGRSRGKR